MIGAASFSAVIIVIDPDAPGFFLGDFAFVFGTELAVAVGIDEDAGAE